MALSLLHDLAPGATRRRDARLQWSFIQLHRAGRVYRQDAPTLWCPECQTAIAQAEVEDTSLQTQFSTLRFALPTGDPLPIATTRPELLPACVAVFVHPDDTRYAHLRGSSARTPLFERDVPILADAAVARSKGTGAVMCCTFGDATDVRWWRAHELPLRTVLDHDGRLTASAGPYAGLTATAARKRILADLESADLVIDQRALEHIVGAHERCGTPVEYLQTRQWFIRILDRKAQLLAAGRRVRWHPGYMLARYEQWVEQLQWDWCISRQRYFGVPFPAWTCQACGETLLADLAQLPVDPQSARPATPCSCGSNAVTPEPDIMDTWATSSCTPLIIAGWPDDDQRLARHFPAGLRPQAHDIIRTWAFYSIVKALEHCGEAPWRDILLSRTGCAGNVTGCPVKPVKCRIMR